MKGVRFLWLLAIPAFGQTPLSLADAVASALRGHPAVHSSEAAESAAAARVKGARSGYFPKLDYQESFTRSNNPVFVFGSLLEQHRFGSANFDIGTLNRPGALDNFQSALTVEQLAYDGGRRKAQVQAADIGRQAAGEDRRSTEMNVTARVAKAYYDAILSRERLRVAGEAVRSAEADLRRAEAVRAAGMSTDADVLAIRVHLAEMREQQIRRTHDVEVSLAALNDAMGLPLDTSHQLTGTLSPLPERVPRLADLEDSAGRARPESRRARLSADLAGAQASVAGAAFRPQISANFRFEADRQTFATQGGANWLAGVSLRWNVFNGFADKAAVAESAAAVAEARATEREVNSNVRLQVLRAYHELQSATERVGVAQAAVTMAEEGLRIVKNRYDGGFAVVTELLRSELALLEARTNRLTAIEDQRVSAIALDLASGSLSPRSESLQ